MNISKNTTPEGLPDVSIVMTYFERKDQLINTIKSFSMNGYDGVEVIIIDDGSIEQPVISDELSCFAPNLDIRVIRIETAEKKYFNPCIPFNKGFAEARGSIIIIQNAECIHVGDIVSYCRKNLDNSKYFSFGCFSIDREAMIQISKSENFDRIFLEKYISRNKIVASDGETGWYNHSVYRPVAYHFTAALTRENLNLLKGFDARYAYGIGHDDDEFLVRLRRSRMKIEIIDDVTVLHQWHYSMTKNLRFDKLYARNRLLLKFVTKREKTISYSRFSIKYLCFLMMLPILSKALRYVERKSIKTK
jgi:glycosyltransferase involved in cell wall biosynthesis